MNLTSIKKFERAAELRRLLSKAGHSYYVLNNPIMEDSVYDRLYRELISLEKENPKLIAIDSPTQRVGGLPVLEFSSVMHRIPLLSLDNAFNFEEVKNWYSRNQKIINHKSEHNSLIENCEMVCELKIDGNAIALSYSNGLLVQAASRGDGKEGEDITSNIKTINSIPLSLNLKNPPKWVEIRGEAFIPNLTFEKINSERKKNGEQIFANPRNACAGTLRQLDPKIAATRNLDFFAYTIHLDENWIPSLNEPKQPDDQWKSLEWLKYTGFKVNPNAQLINNYQSITEFCNTWEIERKNLPYATDGVVIKINKFDLQNQLGFTQKAPRWAIALKYPAEEGPTKLKKLSCQVGRTGAVTPVAEFEAITLAGTSVSRATLHNANRLESLNLHSGDTIVVRKAGDIIPEVVRVLEDLRASNATRLHLPKHCPECNSKLIKETNEAATRCINNSCPAILKGTLRHWVSKSAMDIDGLGSKLIEQLVDRNLVQSITSVYELDQESLESLDRMGKKSAEKLLEKIHASKLKSWSKKLYGLGIHHIGEANAKVLSKKFTSAKNLSDASLKTPHIITRMHGIGDEITQSIKAWFSNENNQKLISDLERLGFSFELNNEEIDNKDKILDENNHCSGKTFVLTGSMSSLSRNKAKEMIEKSGGKVSSSVSRNTTYLVAGLKTGSKLEKAKGLGIKIINEKELLELLPK